MSKQGGTREHPWDKALDSWHGCGKLESLSEVLLFPVLSVLQLGFQLVSLSLGTISHLSSLPHLTPKPAWRCVQHASHRKQPCQTAAHPCTSLQKGALESPA